MTRPRRPPLPSLPPHPPLHELPWMRIECQGETGQWLVFCMAVHDGRIVGGAPIGKNMIGMTPALPGDSGPIAKRSSCGSIHHRALTHE